MDPAIDSRWTRYRDMLTAMEYAAKEIHEETYWRAESRNYTARRGTTWLLYYVFRYVPRIPQSLTTFLADAINRERIAAEFMKAPDNCAGAVKLPHPLGGSFAFLLTREKLQWLRAERERIVDGLRGVPPEEALVWVTRHYAELPSCPLPMQLASRLEYVVPQTGFVERLWANERIA